jgi:hypothetical protein
MIKANTTFAVSVQSGELSSELNAASEALRASLEQTLHLRSSLQNALRFTLTAERSVLQPAVTTVEEQSFRIMVGDGEVEVRGVIPLGIWFGIQTLLREDIGRLYPDRDAIALTRPFPFIIRARLQL